MAIDTSVVYVTYHLQQADRFYALRLNLEQVLGIAKMCPQIRTLGHVASAPAVPVARARATPGIGIIGGQGGAVW